MPRLRQLCTLAERLKLQEKPFSAVWNPPAPMSADRQNPAVAWKSSPSRGVKYGQGIGFCLRNPKSMTWSQGWVAKV